MIEIIDKTHKMIVKFNFNFFILSASKFILKYQIKELIFNNSLNSYNKNSNNINEQEYNWIKMFGNREWKFKYSSRRMPVLTEKGVWN